MQKEITNQAILIIKQYCKEKRIYKAALARHIDMPYGSLIKMLKNNTIEYEKIVSISRGLKYNFLMDLAMQMPEEYNHAHKVNEAHEAELLALKERVKTLETQKELLEKIVIERK